MKSKIVSLSKNEDFKNLLKGKKCSNKYFTIFFKKLIMNSKLLKEKIFNFKNLTVDETSFIFNLVMYWLQVELFNLKQY